MADPRPITISVAPSPRPEVEYYQTTRRTLTVTNTSGERVLIEEVALRFQSDFGFGTLPVRERCGVELDPGASTEVTIGITPTTVFLAATNLFDVKVNYRTLGIRVSGSKHEVFEQQSYLLIQEPAISIGKMFISIKQPDDEGLGRLMARFARRAGFEPFLKADAERPTQDIWDNTILPALQGSDVFVVIWTNNTHWKAEGVRREINCCRQAGIREALVLANDTTKPDLYEGTTIEYVQFDADSRGQNFARIVDELRRIYEGGA